MCAAEKSNKIIGTTRIEQREYRRDFSKQSKNAQGSITFNCFICDYLRAMLSVPLEILQAHDNNKIYFNVP